MVQGVDAEALTDRRSLRRREIAVRVAQLAIAVRLIFHQPLDQTHSTAMESFTLRLAVEPHRVLPEQLAPQLIAEIPIEEIVYGVWEPAFEMRIVGGIHEHVRAFGR